MKLRDFSNTGMKVTPIGLGTWVIGGWMWGGADEQDAIEAIIVSIEQGINLIDTAPVYGFGKAESIVGKALKKLDRREKLVISTKFGLEWDAKERIRRNSSRDRIRKELNDSLERLQTDYIDIYQVHWPDSYTPFEETMSELVNLQNAGKIRAIGVSNFTVAQLEQCRKVAPVCALQPPFNLFEQESAVELLPYCIKNTIGTLTYGTLCRGMLTGKFSKQDTFPKGDLRKFDPKFKGAEFIMYLKAVEKLKAYAEKKNGTVAQLAIEWTINQPGVTCALIGARNRVQAEENSRVLKNEMFTQEDFEKVNTILDQTVRQPLGPEFMAPPK